MLNAVRINSSSYTIKIHIVDESSEKEISSYNHIDLDTGEKHLPLKKQHIRLTAFNRDYLLRQSPL